MNMRKTTVVAAAALLTTVALAGCSGEPAPAAGGATTAAATDGGNTDGADDADDANEGEETTVAPDQVAAQARAYVDAVNANDLDALVESFAGDGAVLDVTRRITGHDAIRRWADNEVMGGTLKVLEITPKENGQDLLVRWAPAGSDGWRAHYRFTFAGDKIALADLQYA
jgi:hypothetical protein